MVAASKERLEQVLSERLGLGEARFELETLSSGRISGNIISDSFVGMDDLERQRRIWDALEAAFGPDSTRLVGTLLAYTKAEWNVELEDH
jgi:acid stress-induced BolA-like protein IbaG/YrbA